MSPEILFGVPLSVLLAHIVVICAVVLFFLAVWKVEELQTLVLLLVSIIVAVGLYMGLIWCGLTVIEFWQLK